MIFDPCRVTDFERKFPFPRGRHETVAKNWPRLAPPKEKEKKKKKKERKKKEKKKREKEKKERRELAGVAKKKLK